MSRRLLALAAAVTVVLSVVGPVAAESPPRADLANDKAGFEAAEATQVVDNQFKDAKEGIFLIRLEDAPVASFRGGVDGFEATNPAVNGVEKLNAASGPARAYADYLEAEQAQFVNQMERTIGRTADVRFSYQYAVNGLAVWLTPQEAANVAKIPGVAAVNPDVLRELHTDAGPAWIGAPGVWGGADCSGDGTCGEGVVVGVLDTGINPSNPSFAGVGPVDGYVHTNPLGGPVGVCNPAEAVYDPTFPCNDKMIGAWNFTTDPGPIDDDGHGSHTASTAAGNIVDATVVGNDDPATPITAELQISGVAPHANVIAYDVCITTAGCPGSAIVAGIDQAVVDGVDVINYSIGGGASDPWNDDDSLGFLAARDAGIFVATSAGNSGPEPATVGSPADAPWITSVGASTHDRNYPNALVDMSGGDTTPPADIVGKGFTNGYGPAPIVYAGDFGDAECLAPFPAGTWTNGEIVVCDRGQIARVEKGANVAAGGASGYVLANDAANGDSLNGDAHFLPAVHISYDDGVVLKAWLASGTSQTATITGAVRDVADANGDIMAGFSSRGPNPTSDIVSPSVTGPGVDIIAADGTGDEISWGFISGTSMSSPHVAGAGALLKAVHPSWSPAQMQSALMLTANTDVLKEDGATPADPFDQGSGSVRVDAAANSGLLLDVTTTEYLDADPGTGGDPTSINLASMANSQCVGACSWTRTVTATSGGSWDVTATADGGVALSASPTSFTLAAGESQAIVIAADVSGATTDVWNFGEVTLTDGAEALHMPVAVQGTTGDLPGLVEVNTRRNAGSHPVLGLTAIEITDLTVEVDGMVIGTQVDESLLGDSDNSSPYDDPTDGAFTTLVAVPAGATHLIAETIFSESPDLDLFVGFDENNDGIPQASEEVCSSTSGTAIEFCDVADPEQGQWWILVQNWSASDTPPDDLTLSYGVLDGTDAGNFSVEGPASAGALEPFDVRVFWDDAALESGDKAYAFFSLGTSPANPGNIGTVPVQLDRHEDDVTKTVSQATAEPGDTLTYEITVLPNVTNEDLAYELTDTIPEGLTYVDGSVTGGATVTNGVLTWEGVQLTPFGAEGDYVVTTSANDESCDTGFGGYVDLESLAGITPDPGVTGDTVLFSAFGTQNPLDFYGVDYTGVSFTDDGFAIHGPENYAGSPWVPQAIPDVAAPNNVMAALWQDFELFYDAATNAGVSLATAGPDVAIIEYDDLQLFGGSDPVADMNIVLWSRLDAPGNPEIVFAYDNLNLGVLEGAPATIGVENADGTKATAYVNATDPANAISDGFQVCFDFQGPTFEPVVITYQVTVDDVSPSQGGGVVSNEVISIVDNPGSQPEMTSAEVEIIPAGVPATAVLGQVVDDLNGMIAVAEGSDYWALRQARYWAGHAMDETRWADESQPNIVGGPKVFIRTRTAVKKLQMIADTSPWYADAQALIGDLMTSSRMVATSGLDAHIATAPADAVADAQYWLNRANRSASNGYPRYAIARYMKSWKKLTAYLR